MTQQMKNVSLNLGRGEVGGGVQDKPVDNSLVRALATALAAGEGSVGLGAVTCK